jgi:hypothetical protein
VKRCTKCRALKSLEEFSRDRSTKDGRCSWCKDCERASGKAYYAQNRERIRAEYRERHANLSEEEKEVERAYERSYAREYYAQHRERLLAADRERWANRTEEQKEEYRAYERAYRQANLDGERARDRRLYWEKKGEPQPAYSRNPDAEPRVRKKKLSRKRRGPLEEPARDLQE